MNIRTIFTRLSSVFLSVCLTSGLAFAQQPPANKAPTAAQPEKKAATTKKVVKKKPTTTAEKVVPQPSLEDRLNDQRQAVKRGEQREQTAPYLIDEISVNGIYRSVEGYGAFLKAINGRTFFAYSGMPFYDGIVLQIDADQVVFQQNLPGGKTKQIVKVYDPSALRASAIEQQEKAKKEKEQEQEKKKKKSKKEADEENETVDDSDDE